MQNLWPNRLWPSSTPTSFRSAQHLIYLNHAAVAPLCRRAADAMKTLADDCSQFGSLHYDQWLAAYEGVRVAAARLINADRSEIALVKNTSEGIATVAMGLDWKPGDRMVGFREEFPANYLPLETAGREGSDGHVALRGGSARPDRRGLPRRPPAGHQLCAVF